MQPTRRLFSARQMLPLFCIGTLLSAGLFAEHAQAVPRKTVRKTNKVNRANKRKAASKMTAKARPVPAHYLQVAPYVRVAAAANGLPGAVIGPAPGSTPGSAPITPISLSASDIKTKENVQITLPQTPGTTTLTREQLPGNGQDIGERVKWTQDISGTVALSRSEIIKQTLEAVIDNADVKVLVTEANGKTFAILSGSVEPDKLGPLIRKVEGFILKEKLNISLHTDNLIGENPSPGRPPDPIGTEIWPLTFLPTKVGVFGEEARFDVEGVVTTLNALYGEKDKTPPITAARQKLILHGPESLRLELKRQLTILDGPPPQVQLDVFAIQMAGKREHLGEVLLHASTEVKVAQQKMQRWQGLLNVVVASLASSPGAYLDADIMQALSALKFDTNPNRRLSLLEMMVFLGAANEQGRKFVFNHSALDSPGDNWPNFKNALGIRMNGQVLDETFLTNSVKMDHAVIYAFLKDLLSTQAAGGNLVIQPWAGRLKVTYGKNKRDLSNQGVYSPQINLSPTSPSTSPPTAPAIPARENFKAFIDKLDQPEANKALLQASPGQLRRSAAAVDRLFKSGVDAFTLDIKEGILEQLLRNLNNPKNSTGKPLHNRGGVSLIGKTRLVVSNGLETSLKPELASFVETTRPQTFGTDFLDTAFPSSRSGGGSTSTTTTTTQKNNGTPEADTETTVTRGKGNTFTDLTGAAGLLAGLNPVQAVLLAGALQQPTPTFTKVAPGIDIAFRPTVMPDNGSARLQVDLKIGVKTEKVNPQDNEPLDWAPADAVQSHNVSTDAIIDSLDLFDISSFAVSSSHPRPPGYIPILGNLPLIGKAFQWRRKDVQLDHHSMILVNTVILPRSMDIANFYGER